MENEENISINIVIQTRSRIAGINEKYTWPDTPINQNWTDLFQQYGIPFDPRFHMLVKRGTVSIDVNGSVSTFYGMFRNRGQRQYNVYIRSRKQGMPDSTVPVRVTENVPGPLIVPPVEPSVFAVPPPRDGNLNNDTRPVPNLPNRQPVPEHLNDDTQAGNVVGPGQQNVKPAIMEYLRLHVSNQDMLDIRHEITTLIRTNQFQRPMRSMPITSGFVRLAFVDQTPAPTP